MPSKTDPITGRKTENLTASVRLGEKEFKLLAEAQSSRAGLTGWRVVVVEDDETSLKYLHTVLTRQGYQVITAVSAEEAKRKLSPAEIRACDCVITDYRMPKSDGLDLLHWIQEQDATLGTIIVTAEGEKRLVTASLRGGAVDYLEKPVEPEKLQVAVSRAIDHTRRQRRLARQERAVNKLSRAQEQNLQAAVAQSPVRMSMAFHPKHGAGGDYFSHFQTRPNELFCLLTDVSGHDLYAAYVSAYFQGVVRGMLERATPVEQIFQAFNRLLLDQSGQPAVGATSTSGIQASIAAGAILIDLNAGAATVFTHGTPAPVYWESDGDLIVVGESGGSPLGWFGDFSTTQVAQKTREGGVFSLWTDGLEAEAERKGVSALTLAAALRGAKARGEQLPGIESAPDDILLVDIHLPPEPPAEELFYPMILEHYRADQAGDIDGLQASWRRSLELVVPGMSDALCHDVLLATREAVLNGMEHGCACDPTAKVRVQINFCPAKSTIRVRLTDSGAGHNFDIDRHEELAAVELLDRQRGLILMRHLSTGFQLQRNGATVTMDFAWR
ncbi:MAG TPA: response regulator [Verrucomicrobiae bacterium]|nr:response regulator [Verrucomicrobiae bacterium]